MSRYLIVIFLVTAVTLSAGCASMNHADSGAALGGLIGAGAGAILGHQTGHRDEGALIGAGLGVLTGAIVGNAMDEVEEEARAEQARTERALHEVDRRNARLSILDVIRMSQAGISDNLIIAKIQQTGSYYELSASEIIDLKRSSVSDQVITYMLRTPNGRYAAG